jgi:hypothetical protein
MWNGDRPRWGFLLKNPLQVCTKKSDYFVIWSPWLRGKTFKLNRCPADRFRRPW